MASREWKFREVPLEGLMQLRAETGLSLLALRACYARGLQSSEEIRAFLSPKIDALTHPLRIRDMDRAVHRLAQARENGEKILIFGDYDVDGTTGAALLTWVLREFGGFQFQVTQPDRFRDGYGLNIRAVEEAAAAQVGCIVTVDCGITSFDAANRAQELGLDLIVIDHHQIHASHGLPAAFAVVNPQRTDCESELKQLCGCGLAFYFALALRMRGRELGWFQGREEPNLKKHLDLVVMATSADLVPLTGDNHILARHGLHVLKRSQKPGVRALLQTAGAPLENISPSHLGFVLGPRINASGRMQSAGLALELLTTTDAGRAAELARELEHLNAERAKVQNEIWDQVRVLGEKGISEGKFKHGIVLANSGWHEGVIGIVASRVTEYFHRPAVILSIREDLAKGSARTWGGKDLLAALRASEKFLLGYGGHKHAAGVSVALDQIEAFAESFDFSLSKIEEDEKLKPLFLEGTCTLDELDSKAILELESLGPFGPGNPEPIFTFRAHASKSVVLKGRHLKFHLSAFQENDSAEFGHTSSNASADGIEAIWFHAAEGRDIEPFLDDLSSQESEWAGVPELNRFRGRVTPTVRVRDWRKL